VNLTTADIQIIHLYTFGYVCTPIHAAKVLTDSGYWYENQASQAFNVARCLLSRISIESKEKY
jgi:hypothetical protein